MKIGKCCFQHNSESNNRNKNLAGSEKGSNFTKKITHIFKKSILCILNIFEKALQSKKELLSVLQFLKVVTVR